MLLEKEGKFLSIQEFEALTGAHFIDQLAFENEKIFSHVIQEGIKLYKKGEMSLEQLWLGRYYQKELRKEKIPKLSIRWISPEIGWGVFAEQDLKKMEFIAEYTGRIKKREKADAKNPYCFEYVVAQGFHLPYHIDAKEQGGISRYINHSSQPNLLSSLATLDHLSHIVLYAKKPIAKGEQLCYDYGPDYWSKRAPPIFL